MRTDTKTKYYNFMIALYNAQSFDMDVMRQEHRVSNRLITLMKERGMIKRKNKITHWTGDMPTTAIANAFAKECFKQSRIANSQSKAGIAQLTIKPIKRVERTQPVPAPDVDLLNYDRSNSKMIIILTVGVILGFLIATIIWK